MSLIKANKKEKKEKKEETFHGYELRGGFGGDLGSRGKPEWSSYTVVSTEPSYGTYTSGDGRNRPVKLDCKCCIIL